MSRFIRIPYELCSPLWAFAGGAKNVFEGLCVGWVSLGIAAASAVGSYMNQKKAANKATSATPAALDISKVISDARTAAASNYANSISLENQYRPGTAALRTSSDASLQSLFAGQTPGTQAQSSLLSSLGGNYGTNQLLEESTSRILGNLRLGGALGADVQAQAMQAALQKGGSAGISGSGAARGLVARDLGLTSLGLEQQRIAQAQQAGTQQAQLNLANLQTQGSLINAGAQNDISRILGISNLIDGRALPESGLSPGSIANMYVGDKNAQDQIARENAQIQANARSQGMNSLLGFGSTLAGSGKLSGLFGGGGTTTPLADGSNPGGALGWGS